MTPRERVFALEQFGIKLGLDHINRILDALDRPERAWPAIHIAGTNGKGSVTAMVERGLRAAGQRTGRYTSPHLSNIEERVAIDGAAVDAATFDTAAADVMAVVDGLRADGIVQEWPTFFEVTTAIAFEIFRRRRVDVAVIEVGLGGRFDATNALTPVVAAVTSIALDHERHLGSTIEQIAFEKAGIVKPLVPVVIGELADAARDVILAQAERQRAPVVAAGLECVTASKIINGRATIDITTPNAQYREVTLGLNGAHQIANAVVAARTLEVCGERSTSIRADDIMTGLSRVEWPARLEWVRVGQNQHVLIDAAHNPAGAQALADYLRAAGVAPLPLVIAVMRDKNINAIIGALAPVVSEFVATQVMSPRCTRASDLAAKISQLTGQREVASHTDPRAAVADALAETGRAVVAGSIFLVGPLRASLLDDGATPIDASCVAL